MAPSSSSTPILLLVALCFVSVFTSHLSFAQILAANTISAAPALLPTEPPQSSSSPAMSPDITPLFPSPGKGELSPTESSLPTIPSSPSPPNPDDISTFGPNTMAIEPSASLPLSSSVSWNSGIGAAVSLGAILSFHLFF